MKLADIDPAFLDDLALRARGTELRWEAFHPGVEIHQLWGDPGGASAALLRYAPGGAVPPHRHEGPEHIFVLSGAQRDGRGSYATGAHVVNAPGSSHTVDSPEGCLVLVVWERPNTLVER